MAVSNEEIVAYLNANPNLSDTQIAAAMNQYGVSQQQVAAATGHDYADVQSRYDAVMNPAVQQFNTYIDSGDYGAAGNLASSYGVSPQTVTDYLNTNPNQFGLSGPVSVSDVSPYVSPNTSPEFYNPNIPVGPNQQYLSGYGGYQPEGSKYYGDNPMPTWYQQKLPQYQQESQALIDMALGMARGRGLSDYWLDALSGGGQAAQQAAFDLLSQAGYGDSLYRTMDYGTPLLKLKGGATLDTLSPSFSPVTPTPSVTGGYYTNQEPTMAAPPQAPPAQPAAPVGGLTAAGSNPLISGGTSFTHPFGTGNQSGVDYFNVDLSSPFSGTNWRDTVKGSLGYSDAELYNELARMLESGDMTLSGLQRELGLNPGEVMALYEAALKYAQENNLPTPMLPAVTQAQAPFYNYGFGPGKQLFSRNVGGQNVVNPIAAYLAQINAAQGQPSQALAEGGTVRGGLQAILKDPVIKGYLRGGSSGQEDDQLIAASPGEYVMDADVVAALGDGNSEAGARRLDEMRENVRRHKRKANVKSIPPKAKSPEQYLKG